MVASVFVDYAQSFIQREIRKWVKYTCALKTQRTRNAKGVLKIAFEFRVSARVFLVSFRHWRQLAVQYACCRNNAELRDAPQTLQDVKNPVLVLLHFRGFTIAVQLQHILLNRLFVVFLQGKSALWSHLLAFQLEFEGTEDLVSVQSQDSNSLSPMTGISSK